jgi:hypothetical protein
MPPLKITTALPPGHGGGTLRFCRVRRGEGAVVDRPVIELQVKPGETASEVAQRLAEAMRESSDDQGWGTRRANPILVGSLVGSYWVRVKLGAWPA